MKTTKRLLGLVLCFVIAMSFSISVNADYSYDGDWEYDILVDKDIILLYYDGDESNIKIPSTIDGYNVKEIDASFDDSVDSDIESITIPSCVTYIAYEAFLDFEDTVFYVTKGSYAYNYVKNCDLVYLLTENLNLSSVKLSSLKKSYTYTGNAIKPNFTLKWNNYKLKNNKDYKVSYSNNKNKGKATIKITGKGKFVGTIKKTFKITQKAIKKSGVYLSNDEFTYNGKKRCPKVYNSKTKKAFKKGKDYKIKVYGGKNVGKHKVKITFKGNYKGTVVKYFYILPKDTKKAKISKVTKTSIHVSWSKVKGVTGYKIYVWDFKKSTIKLYKTTKSNSLTIYRLHSTDDEIDFWICTYKKVKGKNYESIKGRFGWKYLKLSAPSFSLNNSDFDEFRIKFNKKAAYQGQVSYNEKIKNPYSCNFYDNVRYFYNFGSNTKLYVRARQYRYENGALKVGPWKVKTITTI